MKTSFAIIATCVILLLASTQLKAQKQDYIINNLGDTVKCEVKVPPLFGVPRYKTAGSNQWQRISLKNTNEYYTTQNHTLIRRVVKPDGKAVFMKVLENGKISLYEESTTDTNMAAGPNATPTTTISTEWYAAKTPDLNKVAKKIDLGSFGLSFKSKKKRIAEISAMMVDDKAVADKFTADDKFNYKAVRNIIHLYNTGEVL